MLVPLAILVITIIYNLELLEPVMKMLVCGEQGSIILEASKSFTKLVKGNISVLTTDESIIRLLIILLILGISGYVGGLIGSILRKVLVYIVAFIAVAVIGAILLHMM